MTQCFRKDTKLHAVLLSDVQSQKQLEPNTIQVTREISTRQNCASCHEARNYDMSHHPAKETPQNSGQTDSARFRKILFTLHRDPPGSQTLASPTNTTRGCDHRQNIVETAARYVPQLIDQPGKHESQQRTTQHNPSNRFVRHHVSQVLKPIDPSINKNTSPRQQTSPAPY